MGALFAGTRDKWWSDTFEVAMPDSKFALRRGYARLAALLTPRLSSDEESDRAGFLVDTWVFVFCTVAFFLPLNLLGGMWGQVALSSVLVLVGVPLLWRFRRARTITLSVNISLATYTLSFGAAAVMQTPADYSNLATLVLMPMMAAYLLPRGGFYWVALSSLAAIVVVTMGVNGLTLQFVDPTPPVSAVANVSFVVLASWLFMRRYVQVRENSFQRMLEADHAKSVFLSTISHELRTPMNGVLGMAELMLGDTLTGRQRDRLGTLRDSGNHLVGLLDDLLDIVKLETGKLSVTPAPFVLDTLIADVAARTREKTSHRNLTFTLNCADTQRREVEGDGHRLAKVLNNLLTNAVKFTDNGGVQLSVSEPEPDVFRFAVADTGIGISAETIPRLFSLFRQVDGSSTRRHGGAGLGLALSQQLVTLMGGHIEVESTPRAGSTFTFSVRLPQPKHAVQVRGNTRLPVLVVDDNPVNLKVACALVERAGFPVVTATNGVEAVAAARKTRFCLVLMDCQMPVMDGLEAASQIRAMPSPAGETPIVALTASTGADDLAACRRVGMNECLAKPLNMVALRKLLSTFNADHAEGQRTA